MHRTGLRSQRNRRGEAVTASLAVFAAAVTITAAGLAAVAVGSLVAGWKEHQHGS